MNLEWLEQNFFRLHWPILDDRILSVATIFLLFPLEELQARGNCAPAIERLEFRKGFVLNFIGVLPGRNIVHIVHLISNKTYVTAGYNGCLRPVSFWVVHSINTF